MNKSSVTLWVDTDTNALLTGFNTNALANIPTFKQGDNFQIDIHFLKRGANSSIELPTAGSSYKLAIGNPDARPTSGTWVLAYGSSQVEFDYNETAASVETSLNLIPEIIAAGGVTVGLVNGNTTYRITFDDKVATTAFTTDSSNLIPSSYATVSQIKTGSATTRGVWHIKLKQIPAAYQSTWTHSTAPVIIVTALDSNTSRVEISPAPKGGTFAVSGVFTGGISGVWKSKPIPVEATEQMVIDAIGLPSNTVLVSKSGLYSWDITILEFTSNSNLLQYVTDDGDASGIIGYDFVSGEISLNNYEVSSLLLGASFVDTVLEVEVTTGSTVSTVLQTTCRIVAEVIGQGTYSPIPFDNPVSQADIDSTLLNYVKKDGGTMNMNAVLDFYNGVSDSEVGGWGFGVESSGGANYATVTHDAVTVYAPTGSVVIDATGITFPDATVMTTAVPAVDLTDLVSKTDTSTQTIVSALASNDHFETNYSTAEPSYAFNNFGQGIIQIYRNQGASAMAGNASANGDSNWFYQVADGESFTLSSRFVTDTLYTNKMVYAGEFKDGEMYGLGLKYTTNLGTFVETVIYPTGIKFPDASVQTTAGYPRYGNPENYQTYYDVANNYYPLNSNPSGYLHQGDDSTVPAGGLAGQVLTKATNDSYVLVWGDMPSLTGYAQLAGATFLGKVNLPPSATGGANLNLGIGTTPTTLVNGDVWIDNILRYRVGGGTVVTAGLAIAQTFTQPQVISTATSATSPALRITNQSTTGTAHSLVVEDAANPDTTSFVVSNDGSVGIGVDPATFTPTNKLEVQGNVLVNGKVNVTQTTASAGIRFSSLTTYPSGATALNGDLWLTEYNLQYKDSTGTVRTCVLSSGSNTFTSPQVFNNQSNQTLPAVRINNLATAAGAHSFVVEDEANPDTTSFIIDNVGNVGIGVTTGWTATQKFELNGGIKFIADSSVQTTAYIPSAVAITGGSINGITIDGGTY